MITYFISDLHLQYIDSESYRLFERFLLEHAVNANRLYILGDFFDSWIGDDYEDQIIKQIKQHLRKLAEKGVQVFLMVGNRDFHLGQRFAGDTGCHLIDDPTTITIQRQKIVLTHGDLLSDDPEYLKYRNFVRSPWSRRNYLRFPLWLRKWIVRFLKKQSAKRNKAKREKKPKVFAIEEQRVSEMLQKANSLLMIHGHTHQPAVHEIIIDEHTAKRFVLGDWHASTHFIKATDDKLELIQYSLDSA